MNSPENPGIPGFVSVNHPVPEPDAKLWTTQEVARFLHVSLKTVFNLRKRGLPYVQLGGAVRFVPQEIRDYLTRSRGLSSHRLRKMIRNREVGT
jgi:excisionase family DNA binding protein